MNLAKFRTQYQDLQQSLAQSFLQNPDLAQDLILTRSDGVDAMLKDIWQLFAMDKSMCLSAVGGYGRRELHLYSDIDLLILVCSGTQKKQQESIAKFLAFLWDIGLEVGHSTRDIHDCYTEITDLSVATNLLESRLLIGDETLLLEMQAMIKTGHWSNRSFLVEKQKEQHNRHLNYSNNAYNLEPNLKESPGGLRDIQTLAWVAKWYFKANDLEDLTEQYYLGKNELFALKKAQLFLWKVRFALHVIAQCREDRIAFQYQKQVATLLGYVDAERMAVEQFMRDYYQTVTKVARLNDILLQLLEQQILHTKTLNTRFVISHGYIQATNDTVFEQHPFAFIEIFLLITKHNYVRGISAKTLRQMQNNLEVIDFDYYKKRQNNRLFIKLLQQKNGVNQALKLMNRYGVLERYIPAFGKITGLMQYDLFHTYTVDQHTLFVIRNLRRFFVDEFSKEFSLCSKIAQTIDKPELLFLAGLFHDIAKGRGGNHAKLGAQDAQEFCAHHQLKAKDTALVADLVEQHLLMSQTAQKQNLDDRDVIATFAKSVASTRFLEFLYLLTVADIRATKENLWNDWRDSLLKKLFYKTRDYLLGEHIECISTTEQAEQIERDLIINSAQQGYDIEKVKRVFDSLPGDYFLRYTQQDVLWHLSLLMRLTNEKIYVASQLSEHNVVDIFVYSPNIEGLFLKLVSAIEKLGLEIVDAKILTSKDHKAYNTISVLADNMLYDIDLNQVIEQALLQKTITPQSSDVKPQNRHFDATIRVTFADNNKWNLTQVAIDMLDKRGLLSHIAYLFYQCNIRLVNARIATMGECVENVFFVSNSKNQPLNIKQQTLLKRTLEEKL